MNDKQRRAARLYKLSKWCMESLKEAEKRTEQRLEDIRKVLKEREK